MKTQMRFQKIIALVALIISALTIVYGLIFATPIYGLKDMTYANPDYLDLYGPIDEVNGNNVFYMAQVFTPVFLALGIVFLLLVVFMYITASHKRRNYYITNYISVIATAAFAFVMFALLIALTAVFHYYFANEVSWEAVYEVVNHTRNKGDNLTYYDSPAVLCVGYVIAVLCGAVGAGIIINLLWKVKLMKGEKALLEGGLVKEVA